MHTSNSHLTWAASLLLAVGGGCAAVPYRYDCGRLVTKRDAPLQPGEPQFEFGKPRPVIDGIGWVVGIPTKVMLWNIRAENHHICSATAEKVGAYLSANGLDKVKVRLNQYDPLGECRRLRRNCSVGWPWRYTLGTVSILEYALLPGRVFGGDEYNPYTNTISLYSDIPAIGLHEGGHAKDFAHRVYKGTYAALGLAPGVVLWQEAQATRDALGYLHENGSLDEEKEGYRILYPAYGTYVGSVVSPWVPDAPCVVLGAIGGHIAGRVAAARVDRRDEPTARTASPADEPPGRYAAPPDVEPGLDQPGPTAEPPAPGPPR